MRCPWWCRLTALIVMCGQLVALDYQQVLVVGDSHSANRQWTDHAAALFAQGQASEGQALEEKAPEGQASWNILALGGLTPAQALSKLQQDPTWQRPQLGSDSVDTSLAFILLGTNAYDKDSYRQIVDLLREEVAGAADNLPTTNS